MTFPLKMPSQQPEGLLRQLGNESYGRQRTMPTLRVEIPDKKMNPQKVKYSYNTIEIYPNINF